MKKLIFISLVLLLVACNNAPTDTRNNTLSDDVEEINLDEKSQQANIKQKNGEASTSSKVADADSSPIVHTSQEDKMIIYNGHISIETKEYQAFQKELKQHIDKQKGYVVHRSIHKDEDNRTNATITIRIPQETFHSFIEQLSTTKITITNQEITGEDVTEQYVDFQARLQAKQKTEERLLTFMDEATKTEDLLQIASDLERIQEEIEVIQGKMNYLQDQSDYSTITLNITETGIVSSTKDKENLQTWAKTKQAFQSSISNLQAFSSLLVVTFVGYSPIILLFLGIVIAVTWGIVQQRKRRNDKKKNS
ncbi:DUF4349 domain-containing protein [Pontibacillus litoralis]|uniref:DUF4349 domain-containing protein n=1 Tax=Pontibacillus litoralis JSM 072002 TaxID=1385512 RepID=A0A0A5G3W2_9BACI|nr:DUF4349 domain-containing protein [Pontibacillus litoralis]KGX87816.1 hypothetical protein N784_14300 [Pontibacillus litoralis JSM 072002]